MSPFKPIGHLCRSAQPRPSRAYDPPHAAIAEELHAALVIVAVCAIGFAVLFGKLLTPEPTYIYDNTQPEETLWMLIGGLVGGVLGFFGRSAAEVVKYRFRRH
jgi:H+/Cl- antiporter ClcA